MSNKHFLGAMQDLSKITFLLILIETYIRYKINSKMQVWVESIKTP